MLKTALITGASSGLGLEFAKILAAQGYDVVLAARSEDKLIELKKEIEAAYNRKAHVIAIDLTQKESAEIVYNQTKELGLNCEVVINNAGFGYYGKYWEIDLQISENMIDLNITTLSKLTYYFLQDMTAKNKGYILNVASTAAFEPGPLMAVYYATKAFVLSFTDALSNELKGTDIVVSALCPGPTETNFQKNAALDGSKLFKMLKSPSAYEVAKYGIDSLFARKTVAIHGWFNKLLIQGIRISTRKLNLIIVRHLQEKRVH